MTDSMASPGTTAKRRTLWVEILWIACLFVVLFIVTESVVARDAIREARGSAADLSRFGAKLASASIADSIASAEAAVAQTAGDRGLLGALAAHSACSLTGGGSGDFATGHFDLLLPSGRDVCSSLVAKGASTGSGYTGQPWVREVLRSRARVVSSAFTDPLTGEPSIAVAAPVFDGSAIAGIFADVLHLDAVGPRLRERFAGVADMHLTLIDAEDRIILASSESERHALASTVGTPFADGASGARAGLDGVRRFYASARVEGRPWTVLGGLDEATTTAPTRRVLRNLFAQAIATILLVMAAIYLVNRRITGPMRALRADVERAARSMKADPVPARGPAEVADLTDRVNDLLAARAAHESRLNALNEDLEARVEERTAQLERSNAELDRFASLAAHDLQEPLRTITGYADLLAEHVPASDEEARHILSRIDIRASRMRQLIADLLAYARAGTSEPDLAPTDVEDAVSEALDELRGVIAGSGAAVTVVGALPRVIADVDDLTQIFQNLIANALKFHRPDTPPAVRISAERQNGMWIVNVADDGIGVDPRFATRIFEPFRRLHDKEEYPGSGIGLGICAKLAEKQGGRIWVESEPDKGATFRFTLPAA